MSPSESELRASLRAGEGEQLDVDAVLAHARSVRRDRRRNALAIGGAVVAVLAVGGVITGVQLSKDSNKQPGGAGSSSPALVLPQCPGSAPIVPQSYAQADGPLFPADVTAIKVCRYDVERLTTSKDIDGPTAASYAQRFNALPTIRKGQICPQFVTTITIAMLPVTPHGTAPTVVGKIGGCGLTSNGTGSRNASNLLGELEVGLGGRSGSSGPGGGPIVPSHTVSFGPGPS
jgi:hypothetical protein